MRVLLHISEMDTTGCVLVPTMGALHAGHGALVRQGAASAKARGGPGCVVSLFVNPTQFNDPADYERYPRTEEADLALCEAAGAAAVWVPSAEEMYPDGLEERAPTAMPGVAWLPGLEDAGRPGHFAGVVRVVRRLFERARPAAAVFGEKDWQQLAVVRAMVENDGSGVEIEPAPIVREPDGLAMSSRNRFLSDEDRARARALSRAIAAAQGEPTPARAEAAMRRVLRGEGIVAEYAVVRDAATLRRPTPGRPCRAIVTAPVGGVRLLDNGPWPG